MPLKISILMSEEAPSPECDSFTAHCTLEFDDEQAAPQDSEALQHKIYAAIAACYRVMYEGEGLPPATIH